MTPHDQGIPAEFTCTTRRVPAQDLLPGRCECPDPVKAQGSPARSAACCLRLRRVRADEPDKLEDIPACNDAGSQKAAERVEYHSVLSGR
jgi:hypothetical protein